MDSTIQAFAALPALRPMAQRSESDADYVVDVFGESGAWEGRLIVRCDLLTWPTERDRRIGRYLASQGRRGTFTVELLDKDHRVDANTMILILR